NASGKLPIGKGRLYRLLRRFRLPPFTSSTDLEAFIAASVGPVDVDFFRDAVQQCGPVMTNDQRQRALSCLEKRRAICDFIVSEAYLHPVQRTLGAMDLFLGRAYRNSDGMYGLAQDIIGHRTWMR